MSKENQSLKVETKRTLTETERQALSLMLKCKFIPRPGLSNRHIMTMAGHFISRQFPGIEKISQERLFQVTNEAQMLTHCGWQTQKEKSPLVIVVHGLEGSSESKYALGTALKAYQSGFNVLRVNQRGCNNTFHLSPTPYHAGLTNDLRTIIDEVASKDGISSIYLVGFSLGGNQSLKLAGEYGEKPHKALKGVCAISVPIDLADCADSLHWAENWVYEWNFLLSLYKSYKQRKKLNPSRYSLPPFWKVLTMRKFDDLIAGPCNGFHDANDYYNQNSSAQFLKNITVPTLIIQAKDDPFIPFTSFEKTPRSEMVALLATETGGHVGYVGISQPSEDPFWIENRAVEFFKLLSS
ncbi:MAG: alpha/beta fold hydrolase [Acidobacteria bacterium]|nr:alpha/beta fold hydrolase [Acidobacteriota bacterium]